MNHRGCILHVNVFRNRARSPDKAQLTRKWKLNRNRPRVESQMTLCRINFAELHIKYTREQCCKCKLLRYCIDLRTFFWRLHVNSLRFAGSFWKKKVDLSRWQLVNECAEEFLWNSLDWEKIEKIKGLMCRECLSSSFHLEIAASMSGLRPPVLKYNSCKNDPD